MCIRDSLYFSYVFYERIDFCLNKSLTNNIKMVTNFDLPMNSIFSNPLTFLNGNWMETKRHPKIWRKGKGDQPKPASQRQGDVLQQWMHPQRQLNAGHRQWGQRSHEWGFWAGRFRVSLHSISKHKPRFIPVFFAHIQCEFVRYLLTISG